MGLLKKPGTHTEGCFLPDFCNVRVTFSLVMVAELLIIVLAVLGYSENMDFWTHLGMLSLFIQWIVLASSALLCLLKPWFLKTAAWLTGLLAMSLVLGLTLLVSLLGYKLVFSGSTMSLSLFLVKSLSVSFIISLVTLHYFYIQHQLRQQQTAESEARFQALQSRIRPHFLFNSMNTIASLTRTDPVMAERVVEDLADLFRASLADSARLSCIADEITLAKGYLNIENMRLGKRLQVDWSIDDNCNRIAMPVLMLQPLVENAIYHGIEPAEDGGCIHIRIECHDKQVQIMVSNTKVASGSASVRKGNRMALDNTLQRLKALYGDKAELRIEETGELFRVVMQYPVKESGL